uniref:uncharacterized protein LOC122584837 n=1 Tax=Erigeron canadensis TaxID=72917 RepID=UPI001CB95081|nr:uncharacterized protein LOC122584837 [Erigeron canadensis]
MPIVLNIWSPNSNMMKSDLKNVPVWVKLHDVPMVAYTDDGLNMLLSKVGNPKHIDLYTSTMCIDAWGRNSYARAMVELDASHPLKENIVLAIPNLIDEGYTKNNIRVEYEWSPPRCSGCCVFGHSDTQCPLVVTEVKKADKKVVDDGFELVKSKKKAKQGFPIPKPKQKVVYRPVPNNNVNGQTVLNTKNNKGGDKPSTSTVQTSNTFGVLSADDDQIDSSNEFGEMQSGIE